MLEFPRALCDDYYVNLKLGLKLDQDRERQTVLDLFDRVRRQFPAMANFRRYKDELALEADAASTNHQWVALRERSLRAGSVNPARLADAYAFHRAILEIAPFFLGVSPLDADFVELLFGFDLAADMPHDALVGHALLADSAFGPLLDAPGVAVASCQPSIGLTLDDRLEAQIEVKTRPRTDRGPEPLSVYVTLRTHGPFPRIEDLPAVMEDLGRRAEALVDEFAVPRLIRPLHDAIRGGA
ncbi:MAG: hypothetical protein JNM80_13235 [Phycisphaerae bacterium]|nr:hypothetical protein [Phycisphaerae bacterium]